MGAHLAHSPPAHRRAVSGMLGERECCVLEDTAPARRPTRRPTRGVRGARSADVFARAAIRKADPLIFGFGITAPAPRRGNAERLIGAWYCRREWGFLSVPWSADACASRKSIDGCHQPAGWHVTSSASSMDVLVHVGPLCAAGPCSHPSQCAARRAGDLSRRDPTPARPSPSDVSDVAPRAGRSVVPPLATLWRFVAFRVRGAGFPVS